MSNIKNTSDDQLKVREETKFIPLVDWPKYHPWPPIGGLRHLAFFRKTNGFHNVFVKIGRRILVDEAEFLKQIRTQTGTAAVQEQK
jgi:hypothetical protein